MKNDAQQLLNAKSRGLIQSAALLISILLNGILLLAKSTEGESIFSLAMSAAGAESAAAFAIICLVGIGFFSCLYGCVISLVKKRIPLSSSGMALICVGLAVALSGTFEVYGAIGQMILILDLMVLLATVGLCLVGLSSAERESRNAGKYRGFVLLMALISLILTLTLFFLPFCTLNINGEPMEVIPIDSVFGESARAEGAVVFVVLAIFAVAEFVMILRAIENPTRQDGVFAAKLHGVVILSAVCCGLYFTAGTIYCTLIRKTAEIAYSAVLPFAAMTVFLVVYSLLINRIGQELPDVGIKRGKLAVRLEFFFYGLTLSLLTVGACMSDIVKVTLKEPELREILKVNGFKLLSKISSAGDGFRSAAFFLIIALALTVTLTLCTLATLIARSELFHKFALAQCICGVAASMFVGMIGKYYEIVQRINQQTVVEMLEETVGSPGIRLVYSVKSDSFYWFLAAIGVGLIALLRKPYSRIVRELPSQTGLSDPAGANLSVTMGGSGDTPAGVDPCPAFTELDRKIDLFAAKAREDAQFSFGSPTLPTLVQYVVSYARDSRLHLSYSVQDIAAFVAGMGASRLTILQGMSGTGKTSLPKIFCEALFGCCEIIEVESSWRDKHELLGYYNEFSKTYTPKKFTQALYKARLNPDQLTLIVLDEMNLSRIEYYFSDFLSLMENEEDRREIKLLDVGLCRTVEGRRIPYMGLSDGHTLKIPSNVWFVGTANRDESTFEISDKVYDRAHTMNFNKRAPKVVSYREPLQPRRISAGDFTALLRQADSAMSFDVENNGVVRELEQLLAPYNISFGNRVAGQIETFVRIYCACFPDNPGVRDEALETILLSKVVSKLEYRSVEDKESLAESMRELGLNRCSEFVLHLDED